MAYFYLNGEELFYQLDSDTYKKETKETSFPSLLAIHQTPSALPFFFTLVKDIHEAV